MHCFIQKAVKKFLIWPRRDSKEKNSDTCWFTRILGSVWVREMFSTSS